MVMVTSNLVSSYNRLMEKARDLAILASAKNVLEWDMETKMPPRGISLRSQQLAMLSKFEHKMATDPEIGILLSTIEKDPDYGALGDEQKRNVYLIRKKYDEQAKLPEELVAEIARQKAITIDVWKKAKTAKNFAMFKPELEKLVDLKKRVATLLMEVKGTNTPYDALIDIYEPNMPSEKIAILFDELKRGLTSIIDKCLASPRQPNNSILLRRIPIDIQYGISNELARFVAYDIESKDAGGRIDETEHPFTTGYYDDVRITTHYYEENFTSSLFSVLHEAGHALYEQGLNPRWMYQPVGEHCSMGFHEAMSRFVENIVGRSREFWLYFLPKLKSLTGNVLSDVDLDMLVFAINKVKPSKIRIEADEVTYCLHIIVRFEIENDLFAEKVKVAELPNIWNQKYKEYLGLDIINDSEGVMQDTHWASGYYGYFPAYALGNVYGGQILAKMNKDIPDWRAEIAKGNFHVVKNWLTENVYQYGKLYDPTELIKKITGEEINVKRFLDYLDDKYSKLYGY